MTITDDPAQVDWETAMRSVRSATADPDRDELRYRLRTATKFIEALACACAPVVVLDVGIAAVKCDRCQALGILRDTP